MKFNKKWLAILMVLTMVLSLGLAGCKKSKDDKTNATEAGTEASTEVLENYVELALNVYYNDADHSYYDNEAGESIIVSKDGQYTLSFDCSKDLSDAAVAAGVNSLTNLTAIYILDVGSAKSEPSNITACNIKYDSVAVDGTELTITKTDVKSAIKSTGIFDTNDPINAWDGSAVEEVASTSEHVANFTTVKNPTKISFQVLLGMISRAKMKLTAIRHQAIHMLTQQYSVILILQILTL